MRILDVFSQDNTKPVYVVAGATTVGIGNVYEVADSLRSEGYNIKTVGIVSEKANEYPDDIAKNLDYYVDIEDPNGTWQVMMDDGTSYMIDVLKHSSYAKASFIGGGLVAKSEIEELDRFGESDPMTAASIAIEVRYGGEFSPNPTQVAKAIAKA